MSHSNIKSLEATLNDILNSAIACIISYRLYADCHWEYDYFSAGCETIYGYTAEELMANQTLWWSRLLPEEQQVILDRVQIAIKEKSVQYEYRFHHKDDSIRWISSSLGCRRDEAGDCWIATAVDTDISDRKRAEEARRKSEEKFATAFHSNPDAVTIVSCNDGRYIEVNETFCHATGYRPDEVIGKTPLELNLWTSPDDRDRMIQLLQENGVVRNLEADFRMKSGEVKTTLLSADLIEVDGQPSILAVLKDISDRKHLERALHRLNQQLQEERRMFVGGPVGLFKWHNRPGWPIEYVSPNVESLFGYPLEDWFSGNILYADIIFHADLNQVTQEVITYSASDASANDIQHFQHTPYRIVTASGQVRWVDDHSTLVRNEDGQITHYLGYVVDVSDRQHTQEALWESEGRFQAFMKHTPAIAWIDDGGGHTVYANEAYFQLVQRPAPEVIGKSIDELFEASIAQQYRENNQCVLGLNQTIQTIEINPDANGKQRYYLAYKFPIAGSFGQRFVGGICFDVTEQKQAEQELWQAHQQLTYHVENSPLATIMWDRDFRVQSWSQRAEEMFGWKAEEVLGKTAYEWHFLHEDDLEAVSQVMSEMRSGCSRSICHTRNYRNDGSIVHCEWYYSVLFDESGNLLSFLALVQDVSDRKTAEIALHHLNQQLERKIKESTTHLQLAVSTALIGIWEQDLLTQVESWSPEQYKLLGFCTDAQQRVLDRDGQEISPVPTAEFFLSLVHPEDREQMVQIQQQALAQRSIYESEYRVCLTDGTERWFYVRGAYVYDEQDCPIKLIGVSMDVTERKQAEEQLKSSLQEKEVLFKEVHHRVKNNLQIISSLLRMQFRQIQEPQIAALFQEAQNRVQSMALIHEQLYQSPELSQINFGDYVRTLVNHLYRSYGVSQQAIALNVETNNLSLTLNTAIPCGLIINELVSNSLKYGFPDGRSGEITVHLRTTSLFPDSAITLTIGDNGVGIPDTLDLQTTHSLGLRIVHNLVAQLQGTLILNRHHGTVFQITFPNSLLNH